MLPQSKRLIDSWKSFYSQLTLTRKFFFQVSYDKLLGYKPRAFRISTQIDGIKIVKITVTLRVTYNCNKPYALGKRFDQSCCIKYFWKGHSESTSKVKLKRKIKQKLPQHQNIT